jgi:hypothetical protein
MRSWLLLSLVLSGCAGSIEHTTLDPTATEDNSDDDTTSGTEAASPGEVTGPEDGVYAARVDATDYEAWTYLDLAGATVHFDGEAAWDLRFQRAVIEVNGGVTGDGGVTVAVLAGVPFAEASAPEAGWITDSADADADGDPERAFDTWFAYDVATHVLTPADQTYVVRGAEDHRVRLLSYYDSVGTSAIYELTFALAVAP